MQIASAPSIPIKLGNENDPALLEGSFMTISLNSKEPIFSFFIAPVFKVIGKLFNDFAVSTGPVEFNFSIKLFSSKND